jgi:hypothetical protein
MGYLDTVAKILNCICHVCSRLKEPPSKNKNEKKKKRYEHIIA